MCQYRVPTSKNAEHEVVICLAWIIMDLGDVCSIMDFRLWIPRLPARLARSLKLGSFRSRFKRHLLSFDDFVVC